MSPTILKQRPSNEEIAQLPLFAGVPLDRIEVLAETPQFALALRAIENTGCIGFDTESKPTFARDQVSDGPHTVQLATSDEAWVFQLHDPQCRTIVTQLLAAPEHLKAGFGLGDDRKRIIAKLGVSDRTQAAVLAARSATSGARG